VGFSRDVAAIHQLIGQIALSNLDWEGAVEAFAAAEAAHQGSAAPVELAELRYLTGRAHLAALAVDQAHRCFESAVPGVDARESDWDHAGLSKLLASLLNGLEAVSGDPKRFQAGIAHHREEHPALNDLLSTWSLELSPEPVAAAPQSADRGSFTSATMAWVDPFGDSRYHLDADLTIQAANARHLWRINQGAPRLIQPLPAEVTHPVIQATCEPALDVRPAIGGLLLWKDKENYLWLEVGRYGFRDVAFGGCLDNRDLVIGRGRLPDGPEPGWAMGEPVTLRFEVTSDRVEALCTLDEETWFSAGHTTFPFDETVKVGVHAIGMIDRAIYHGAYPDGTAIRFTSFKLWRAGNQG
jgi:hypothetical protein